MYFDNYFQTGFNHEHPTHSRHVQHHWADRFWLTLDHRCHARYHARDRLWSPKLNSFCCPFHWLLARFRFCFWVLDLRNWTELKTQTLTFMTSFLDTKTYVCKFVNSWMSFKLRFWTGIRNLVRCFSLNSSFNSELYARIASSIDRRERATGSSLIKGKNFVEKVES